MIIKISSQKYTRPLFIFSQGLLLSLMLKWFPLEASIVPSYLQAFLWLLNSLIFPYHHLSLPVGMIRAILLSWQIPVSSTRFVILLCSPFVLFWYCILGILKQLTTYEVIAGKYCSHSEGREAKIKAESCLRETSFERGHFFGGHT